MGKVIDLDSRRHDTVEVLIGRVTQINLTIVAIRQNPGSRLKELNYAGDLCILCDHLWERSLKVIERGIYELGREFK